MTYKHTLHIQYFDFSSENNYDISVYTAEKTSTLEDLPQDFIGTLVLIAKGEGVVIPTGYGAQVVVYSDIRKAWITTTKTLDVVE